VTHKKPLALLGFVVWRTSPLSVFLKKVVMAIITYDAFARKGRRKNWPKKIDGTGVRRSYLTDNILNYFKAKPLSRYSFIPVIARGALPPVSGWVRQDDYVWLARGLIFFNINVLTWPGAGLGHERYSVFQEVAPLR